MDASTDINPELETFREQWRAEVRAKRPAASGSHHQSNTHTVHISHAGPSRTAGAPGPPPPRPTAHTSVGKSKVLDTDEDYAEALAFDDPEPTQTVQPARQKDKETGEPVTALDHYERAVEKESQGSLGDSLMLYRKAFRVRPIIPRYVRPSH